MVKFPKLHCLNCNYSFIPKERMPKVCPYCSKEGTLEQAKQVQDYLNDL